MGLPAGGRAADATGDRIPLLGLPPLVLFAGEPNEMGAGSGCDRAGTGAAAFAGELVAVMAESGVARDTGPAADGVAGRAGDVTVGGVMRPGGGALLGAAPSPALNAKPVVVAPTAAAQAAALMKFWVNGASLEMGEMKEAPPVHCGAPNSRPGGRLFASAAGFGWPPGLSVLACLLLPAVAYK